jgi:diacylglycerol kinase family enzyme
MPSDAMSGGVKKNLFIINPVSFKSEPELDGFIASIDRSFKEIIKEEYDIRISRFPRNAPRIVRQYITRVGRETTVRVYAVGGDGILFDCLNGIIGSPNADLAVIPYGHTNDFMRAFGEGLSDLFRDIPQQAAAPAIPADVLYCCGNYALNHCVIGLESAAIFQVLDLKQKCKAWPKSIRNCSGMYNFLYLLGGGIAMLNKKVSKQEYSINIDGEDLSGTYFSVNIANGACYGGNRNAAVTAIPDDGLMDILLFKSSWNSPKNLLRILPYTKGLYRRFPENFVLRRGKTISVRSNMPLMIGMDGEAFFDTNITVNLIPGAVKIAAPKNLSFKMRAPFHEL